MWYGVPETQKVVGLGLGTVICEDQFLVFCFSMIEVYPLFPKTNFLVHVDFR